ncbi:MAG: chorismate mutase [Bacteroidales bacterium]
MSITLQLSKELFAGIYNSRPYIIAGPCSAETEEQVLATAHQLAAGGVKIFRAGIWKPRTRPNSFEGIGSEGLPWLRKVKEETGMLIATEVANAKHVYESLKFGVDILWIGARTSANPFAVQEIADAVKGLDIPMFVKNPVNPDLELWIGALERLNGAGITRLAAVHRGFSAMGNTTYRNDPQWQIPIELRRRIPQLPILIDPSHIGGKRELIHELSQQAMDLLFDGLMIEAHINPAEAWSDAAQQITPAQLHQLVNRLVIRQSAVEGGNAVTLEELRTQIDAFDDQVLDVLAKRMKVADQIGWFKKQHNITILQTARWDQILTRRTDMALAKGLSREFTSDIFRAIHEESISHQNKIMNEEPGAPEA